MKRSKPASDNPREFAPAFSRDMSRLSERRQSRNSKFAAKLLKSLLERVKGIEPSYSAWKAAALPLSYTRITGSLTRPSGGLNCPGGGFRQRSRALADGHRSFPAASP